MPDYSPLRPLRPLVLVGAFAIGLPCAVTAADDDEYRFGHSRFGAFVIPVPLELQAEHNLVPGQGVLVVATRPGGTAETMGIHPGDVILTLNDTPLASRQDVRGVVRSVQPGDAAAATIAGSDGAGETLTGAFKPRQPWVPHSQWSRMEVPPDWWADARATPAEQIAELLAQSRALDDARRALADLAAATELVGQAASGAAESGDVPHEAPWALVHAFVGPGATQAPAPLQVESPAIAPVDQQPDEPAWRLIISIGPITAADEDRAR